MAILLYCMFIVIIFNVMAKYHRGHFWLNIDTAIILWVFSWLLSLFWTSVYFDLLYFDYGYFNILKCFTF